MTAIPNTAPRKVKAVPAWLALSFGLAGVVFIPVPFLNNATCLLAVAGLVVGVIGLFGTRRVLAAVGLLLCVGAIAGTIAIQVHWTHELDSLTTQLNSIEVTP